MSAFIHTRLNTPGHPSGTCVVMKKLNAFFSFQGFFFVDSDLISCHKEKKNKMDEIDSELINVERFKRPCDEILYI